MTGTREMAMLLQKIPFHVLACIALVAALLAGCSTPPAYSVQQPAAARAGVVESIRSQTVQTANSTAGTVVGAVAGGLLGNMVGGGTGRTVATVVGAVGGGYAGNKIAEHQQQLVWIIDVRYDDGTIATIQQSAAPGLRVGDRVLVSQNGIQLLR
jgi:outer membrane lipoprotein SlyB